MQLALPGLPQLDSEGLTVEKAEMAGMNDLFDLLDLDNDQKFEQQELRGMMAQLGLDSKNARAWKWEDALRKMDGDNNELISKREVISHMTRVRMSKLQVADWLTHAVGLQMYADNFLANSITGHDLPTLLKDSGDQILQDELGVKSLLHRKQLRRAIVARLLGDPAPRPPPLFCQPGTVSGSIMLSWEDVDSRGYDDTDDDDDDNDEEDDDEDDDEDDNETVDDSEHEEQEEEVTYRVRRQDPITKEWQTVSAGSSNQAFLDTGLDPSSAYSYKLDAWSIAGVSEKREKRACSPKQGAQTTLWRYYRFVADIFMSMEAVGFVVAAAVGVLHMRRQATAADLGVGSPKLQKLSVSSSAPELSRRLSGGSESSSSSGGTGRSSSIGDLGSLYAAAPNGQLAPNSRGKHGSPQYQENGRGASTIPRARSSGAVNIQKDFGPVAAAKQYACLTTAWFARSGCTPNTCCCCCAHSRCPQSGDEMEEEGV